MLWSWVVIGLITYQVSLKYVAHTPQWARYTIGHTVLAVISGDFFPLGWLAGIISWVKSQASQSAEYSAVDFNNVTPFESLSYVNLIGSLAAASTFTGIYNGKSISISTQRIHITSHHITSHQITARV